MNVKDDYIKSRFCNNLGWCTLLQKMSDVSAKMKMVNHLSPRLTRKKYGLNEDLDL